MIALITSTIIPTSKNILGNHLRSALNPDERFHQTLKTIDTLKIAGFEKIFIVDNSEKDLDTHFLETLENLDILVLSTKQYQFDNRSVNEVLLLLYALSFLPDDEPILKISGRYFLNNNFILPTTFSSSFIVKPYDYEKKNGTISTRCYMVKNKRILERTLKKVLAELYLYNLRVVGFRSYINYLKQFFQPKSFLETTISVEMAFCRVLKYDLEPVVKLNLIGLEGSVAGGNGYINE